MKIFIVGAPRSGTSRLITALARTTGLPFCYEGHLYPVLLEIEAAMDKFVTRWKGICGPETMVAKLDREMLRSKIRAAVGSTMESIVGPEFIEKTPGPEAILALPAMLSVWPDARIIFAKRRGIEVVISASRKFPHWSFAFTCQHWVNCMSAWESVREFVSAKSIEIDQIQTAKSPHVSAQQLCKFLELDHEHQMKLTTLLSERIESGQSGSEYRDALALDQAPWTDEEKSQFLSICSSTMNNWGYALDSSYLLRGRLTNLPGN